jgi:hypothetical protein
MATRNASVRIILATPPSSDEELGKQYEYGFENSSAFGPGRIMDWLITKYR